MPEDGRKVLLAELKGGLSTETKRFIRETRNTDAEVAHAKARCEEGVSQTAQAGTGLYRALLYGDSAAAKVCAPF